VVVSDNNFIVTLATCYATTPFCQFPGFYNGCCSKNILPGYYNMYEVCSFEIWEESAASTFKVTGSGGWWLLGRRKCVNMLQACKDFGQAELQNSHFHWLSTRAVPFFLSVVGQNPCNLPTELIYLLPSLQHQPDP
jgi:hypothetical protein